MKSVLLLMCSTAAVMAQAVATESVLNNVTPVVAPRVELRLTQPQGRPPSGIRLASPLTDAARLGNPLHLLNPFAPQRYGDGWANVSVDPITGRAQGIRLLVVRF